MKFCVKLSLIAIFAFALALCSCSMGIPDGQGLLVVDTESDAVYLKSVYAKKSGAASYSRVWNEKHGLESNYGNIYLDVGKYKVYAVTALFGVVPSIATTGFAEIEVRDGETKFLHVNGLFLSE